MPKKQPITTQTRTVNTGQLLDHLHQYRLGQQAIQTAYQARRDEILAQVQDQLEELDAEFQPLMARDQELIANVEQDIKMTVLQLGESVKGNWLHAVYSRGRVTWDTKWLEGYAATHQEILTARKEGEPVVAIRPCNGGKYHEE